MPERDIITIGGSAGGVEALRTLIGRLPGDLKAALFVVLHTSPDKPSLLPTLLNHAGSFLALHPADGAPIRNGCIYVAPPDHHLLIEGLLVRVVRGPRENRARPAIDPLFRSAAACYGERVVGIILSGALDDGAAGLLAIKRGGGVTMVQDPRDALISEMPESALSMVKVDHCLPVVALAERLIEVIRQPAGVARSKKRPSAAEAAALSFEDQELRAMAVNVEQMESNDRPGTSSPYSCPDCGGVLWEIDDSGLLRFRCRVGHAFSMESMLAEQSAGTERALWMALKTLEERASLLRRMIKNAQRNTNVHLIARFSEELHQAEEGAAHIRKVLLGNPPASAFDHPPVEP